VGLGDAPNKQFVYTQTLLAKIVFADSDDLWILVGFILASNGCGLPHPFPQAMFPARRNILAA